MFTRRSAARPIYRSLPVIRTLAARPTSLSLSPRLHLLRHHSSSFHVSTVGTRYSVRRGERLPEGRQRRRKHRAHCRDLGCATYRRDWRDGFTTFSHSTFARLFCSWHKECSFWSNKGVSVSTTIERWLHCAPQWTRPRPLSVRDLHWIYVGLTTAGLCAELRCPPSWIDMRCVVVRWLSAWGINDVV